MSISPSPKHLTISHKSLWDPTYLQIRQNCPIQAPPTIPNPISSSTLWQRLRYCQPSRCPLLRSNIESGIHPYSPPYSPTTSGTPTFPCNKTMTPHYTITGRTASIYHHHIPRTLHHYLNTYHSLSTWIGFINFTLLSFILWRPIAQQLCQLSNYRNT